jgi:uncharacterized coiled-coil DUF342 family protein
MMTDGKDLVWVKKELIPQLEFIEDILKLKKDDIQKEIDKLVDSTQTLATDNIDTSLLELKLHAQKVRDEYKKTVDDELEKTNKLWEDCDEKLYNSKTKISGVKDSFYSLRQEINTITKKLNDLPLYKLEQFMDLLDRFNGYSDEQKELLKIMLNK